MNRQTTTNAIEADDELLTSFLDQELSPDERSLIERRLVDEEGLRKRLAEMRRAWELLDELPETPLNQHFTKSTMEMVALDLEKDHKDSTLLLGKKIPRLPRFFKTILLAAAGALVIVLGSVIGTGLRNRSQESESRQLAIAGTLPVLQEFPDVKMLEELTDIPRWKDLLEISAIRDNMIPPPPLGEDFKSIKEWVGRLDVHHKELVYDQKQLLDRMSPEDRTTIEERYRLLRSQPNADELQELAAAMYAVLQKLRMNQRANIRSLPKDRKTVAIRQEACLYLCLMHGTKLTEEEKKHLDEWSKNELFPQLRESTINQIGIYDFRLEDLLYWKLFSPVAASQLNLDAVSDLEGLMESLGNGLAPDTRQLFEGVAPNSQLMVIATWVLQKRPDIVKELSVIELFELYKKLPDDRKEQIDMQRPEEARRELEASERQKRRLKGPGRPGGGLGGPNGPGPGPNGSGQGPSIPPFNRPDRNSSPPQPEPERP